MNYKSYFGFYLNFSETVLYAQYYICKCITQKNLSKNKPVREFVKTKMTENKIFILIKLSQ